MSASDSPEVMAVMPRKPPKRCGAGGCTNPYPKPEDWPSCFYDGSPCDIRSDASNTRDEPHASQGVEPQ